MHYLSTIVNKGGAFLHMRYAPWVRWRQRSGADPAARFWQPRHPDPSVSKDLTMTLDMTTGASLIAEQGSQISRLDGMSRISPT